MYFSDFAFTSKVLCAKCVDKTKFETVLLSSILKQQIVKQITDRKIGLTKKKDEKVRIHARVASA